MKNTVEFCKFFLASLSTEKTYYYNNILLNIIKKQ